MKNIFNSRRWRLSVLVLLGGAAAFVSGCSTCKPGEAGKPKVYNIEVRLDDALKGKCQTVDVVGVNPAGLARWQDYSMASYWKDGDPLRRDSKSERVVFDFGEGKPDRKSVV